MKVPKDYPMGKTKALTLGSRPVRVDLFARNFSQGNLMYVEITGSETVKITSCRIAGRNVVMTRKIPVHRGFYAIHPETPPGNKPVVVSGTNAGRPFTVSGRFSVAQSPFPYHRRALDLGKYSDVEYHQIPENIAFIRECARKKKIAFSITSEDKLGPDLAHPRDMHYITSPYWSKRTYMRYKIRKGKKIRLKNRIKVHRGLDLRGNTGTPVFSLARGRVVLAEELFYEGNMLVIDHGNRIFSYFMHLNKMNVRKGDLVTGGQAVGEVGSTGVSTAAHLHVSLMVRGIQVDPLSILYLPIRD